MALAARLLRHALSQNFAVSSKIGRGDTLLQRRTPTDPCYRTCFLSSAILPPGASDRFLLYYELATSCVAPSFNNLSHETSFNCDKTLRPGLP